MNKKNIFRKEFVLPDVTHIWLNFDYLPIYPIHNAENVWIILDIGKWI